MARFCHYCGYKVGANGRCPGCASPVQNQKSSPMGELRNKKSAAGPVIQCYPHIAKALAELLADLGVSR